MGNIGEGINVGHSGTPKLLLLFAVMDFIGILVIIVV